MNDDAPAASPLGGLAGLAAHWPEIDRLLDEALALPAPERSAWLAGRPGLAAPVRESLQRLLATGAEVETGDFLHRLPPVALPAGDAEPALPAAGARVGPWRLLRLLGEGGMGQVFLAERADGQMKREVALKLPRLGWLDRVGGLAERLARERDILAALAHPHIARLYDAGVDELGRPWLALEFVDGQPLTDWCTQRGSGVAERLQLLLQVADAVSAAHARLVVHRDLKPANILVTPEGRAMLLDFGIAGLVQPDGAAGATVVGPRALTRDYASPEQVRGLPLGTASDVYSLGVVAYELLAGVRPYRPRRDSPAALEDAIEHDDAPPASRACAEPVRARALRGDLDAILAKALRKLPAERYASVDAFAQDLRRHLAHEPVLAQPDSLAYRGAKFLRRHALPVAAGTATALALAVGLAVALAQAEAARASAAIAQAERLRAEEAGALAARREAEARQAEQAARDAEQRARAAAEAAGRERDRAERAASAERRAAAAERAAAARAQASQRAAQSEAQRAGLVGNTLLNTLSRIAADPAFRTGEARERMGTALQSELDKLKANEAAAPSGVAEAHGVAASVFNYLQQPERQLQAARREQQLLVQAGETPLRIAESHRQLALALARQVGNAAALDEARVGLAALGDAGDADALLLRGRLHRAASRYARQSGQAALAYAHGTAGVQALSRLDARSLEPHLHHLGAALADWAVAAAAVERDDEALQALARVEALYATPRTALREADRADLALARCQVKLQLEQPAAAEQACRQALALYAPQFGAVGANADTVDTTRATALVRAGKLDEAGAVLQRIRDGATGVPAWLPSAEWALARGDLAQAEAWLARADSPSAPSVRRVEHRRLLAQLRWAQGRRDEALAHGREALAMAEQSMPGAWRTQRQLRDALARLQASTAAAAGPGPAQDPAPAAAPPAAAASVR
jgi:serine/threonine-protein kinase